MRKDNLRVLPGNATPSINKEQIRKMKEDLPLMKEYLQLAAELTKAKYEALKAQGFTPAEALELSKTLV